MTGPADRQSGAPGIRGTAEFLAHALAIESEAEERYRALADQMAVHNNPEVADLFHTMAEIEGKHRRQIEDRIAALDLPSTPAVTYRWETPEGPETTAFAGAHYRMTPHHALSLALENEARAQRFFEAVAAAAEDGAVRRLAADFAAEEADHVDRVKAWLAKYPPPAADWAEDWDPAAPAD